MYVHIRHKAPPLSFYSIKDGIEKQRVIYPAPQNPVFYRIMQQEILLWGDRKKQPAPRDLFLMDLNSTCPGSYMLLGDFIHSHKTH